MLRFLIIFCSVTSLGASMARAGAMEDCKSFLSPNVDWNRVIGGCTIIIQQQPRGTMAYQFRAMGYEGINQPDRAIADYTKAMEIDPKDAMNYSGRGSAFVTKNDYDRAIVDYTKAISFDPNLYSALIQRARLYLKTGKPALALPDINAAIARLKQPTVLLTRAEIYEALARPSDAVADYRAALQMNPNVTKASDALKRLGQ